MNIIVKNVLIKVAPKLNFNFKKFTRVISNCSNAAANNVKLDIKLGFIGTGKIAQAIIIGLINRRILDDSQIFASDKSIEQINQLKLNDKFKNYKINFCQTNEEVVQNSSTIFLSVKPNDLTNALNTITPHLTENHLLLSVAAGIRLQQIKKVLSKEIRIIRIMTNIAALIQEGCSVYAKNPNCTKSDVQLVEILLNAIGTCEGEIDENLIDIVTAVSGSGPAYMCLVADSLADGAVKMGLTRDFALKLITRTMYGTAIMLERNYLKNINQLKTDVCSPGGTTIYGIHELEKSSIRHAFIKCVESATERAKQLNQ